MRRLLTVLTTVALTLGVSLTSAASASAASCSGLIWGSLPERTGSLSAHPVTDVRTGRHECFDRIVIDVGGPDSSGWDVRYVRPVVQQGSGLPYRVEGGARLSVVVGNPVHDWSAGGRLVFSHPIGPVADVRAYETLRAVHFVGSFEGRTQFAVGVRARLPFRVFHLDGPDAASRIVVDVAHSW